MSELTIQSSFVGAKLKTHSLPVTWRHAMNFAASIGDNNPRYFDDERDGGIIAHPMLCVALTWAISKDLKANVIADDLPAHLARTQVHYMENIQWRKPIVPGTTLTISGNVIAILPHPAGALMVLKYDATDETGSPVFTEFTGALLRSVKCLEKGKGKDSLPVAPKFKPEEEPIWQAKIPIDPLAAHVYDAGADISFPIHTSPRFAHAVGLPGIILHGTATLSIAVRELVNREADADPSRLQMLDCRFTDMVLPGTSIIVELQSKEESSEHTDLRFVVLNDSGKRAVSGGFARIRK